MKVAEHLYVYLWNDPRENNCNTIFIDGKVPLLIDPGLLPRVQDLFGRMRADGADPGRIRLVISTHAHPDHFEGTLAFKDPAVKIAVSQQEEKYIEEMVRTGYAGQGGKLPDYRIDLYLKEGDLILGRHEFQIFLTPGHTPGGLSIYWPRHKVLISGDVVFMQSVGRSDFPGGNSGALKESVEHLSRLSVELLVPGHGPAIQGAERVRTNFEFVRRMHFR
jgi:hydroxyacylglutathione hydrolase